MGKKSDRVKRQPMGLARKIILMICLIVFCGSAAYIGLYVKDNTEAEKGFKAVTEKKENGLEEVYLENPDTVGWIEIEGTKINYPVMQTVGDPEFYLRKDFEKSYSDAGTPFMDAMSSIGEGSGSYRDGRGTWNWFIYGHNMKFGTMFHDLLEYDSYDFWKEHKTLRLDVITEGGDSADDIEVEEGEYEILACAYSKIREVNSEGFRYYAYPGYNDRESFDEFVAGIKKESCYDTGITPEYGDQLVTLSTCAYHTDEGRFYMVARKVDR